MAFLRGMRPKPATAEAGRPRRVGKPAPAVEGLDTAEGLVLLFMTSSCAPCRQVWAALAALGPRPDVVVVTPNASTESRRAIEALAPPGTRLVMSSQAWFDYGAGPAPWMAVLSGGVIAAEGPAPTAPEGLLAALAAASPPAGSDHSRPDRTGPTETGPVQVDSSPTGS